MLQFLAHEGLLESGLKVRPLILPDIFVDHDTPAAMYARAGLDWHGIVAKVFQSLSMNVAPVAFGVAGRVDRIQSSESA